MQKILPGILDQNFEFFNHQQENDVKYFHNGKLSSFTSLPSPIYALIKTTIDQSQKVSTILKKWFPNSEFHQIKKFLSCRFGGVDFKADIENGQLQKGEYWNF